jgi:Protein of unknown function (DUF3592)
MAALIFGVFALVVLMIIAAIVSAIKRKKEINWLKEHGKHVQATVSEITSERVAVQVPRQVPSTHYNPVTKSTQTTYHTEYQTQWQTRYFIIARYKESPTKQEYVFKSSGLVSIPTHYMQGSKVLVHYDPANPTRYYMEVA